MLGRTDISLVFVVDAAKDVVRRLLCVDPAKRISLAELLRHPWFSVSVELFSATYATKCDHFSVF